ncbi:hypothetical protein D3273_02720 [Lichenibacterium minor]|uniref:Uncharacterized protein n=1 Tax=Lichenibacterium minor TaxID=2316528 RepID=A0A4Q2UF27_9HYPH|nr:hypothetical protein [Lichenibacterium minor]RYC33405.1 hypothetical protein D3273_02720 [Lichenibacterium minor]
MSRLGGYRIIDAALDTVIDGLRRNPFGFDKFESDLFSFRYARTAQMGGVPPLYVIFTIEADRTVTLVHVEEIAAV